MQLTSIPNSLRVQQWSISFFCLVLLCAMAQQALPRAIGDIHYIRNAGQLEQNEVLFYAQTGQKNLYLQRDRVIFQCRSSLGDSSGLYYRYDLQLEGMSPNARIEAGQSSGARHHFYQGHNIADAVTDVASYHEVIYKEVYPHIDLVCYSEGSHFKYDFIVHPGGNPGDIRLRLRHDSLATLHTGAEIALETPIGSVKMAAPYTYQGSASCEIASSYTIGTSGSFGFRVADYDPTADLVIDPTVSWGRLWGGDGADEALGLAIDPQGNIYQSGATSSASFPGSVGLGSGYSGTYAHLSKYAPDGTLLWSIVMGSNGNDASATDVETDQSGYVYLCGYTDASASFPTTNGSYADNGYDCFGAKLDANGVIQWSIPYGGGQEDKALGLTLDNAQNVTYTGYTEAYCTNYSPPSFCDPDFPATTDQRYNSNQTAYPNHDNTDLIAVSFTNTGTLRWATQLGNDEKITSCSQLEEYGSDLVADANNNLHISGKCVIQGNYGDHFDNAWHSAGATNQSHGAWLVSLNTDGTYRGMVTMPMVKTSSCNNYAEGTDIMLNASGEPIITGYYDRGTGGNQPWVTTSYSLSEYSNAFAIKFGDSASHVWDIEWGLDYGNESIPYSSEDVQSHAIAPTDDGGFIITGLVRTLSASSSQVDPEFTINTWAGTPSTINQNDVFVAKFQESGTTTSMDWSFKYAGAYDDHAYALAVDECDIYVAGVTNASYTGSITQVVLPNTTTSYSSAASPTTSEAFLLHFECDLSQSASSTSNNTLGCDNCISSFAPYPSSTYVLSAWVREEGGTDLSEFTHAQIELDFAGAGTLGPYSASGPVIDGWQRIEQEFTIPASASELTVELINTSSSDDVFFDDIRFFPVDGNMKSYVYDPFTQRLMAELDENNYAIYYEYDKEGKLVRVKRETERGIQTIQETRNNMAQ